MKYTLSEIASFTDAKIIGGKQQQIKQITTDSRTFYLTENTLFVAIKGKNHDGHNYIEQLYNKGVRNFIVSKPITFSKTQENASFLIVKDTVKALQSFAKHHREQFKIPVVSVTGSNGKTIIKDWIFQLIENKTVALKSPKSYNSQIGVPLSVLMLDSQHKIAIFEAGISQVGEMEKLEKIISPQIGIFSNIGDAHQENFIDKKTKIKEKLKLFKNSQTIIYCKDYKEIDEEVINNNIYKNKNIFCWSQKENADLKILQIDKKQSYTNIHTVNESKNIIIKIPFTDNASVENAIHVLSFLLVHFPNTNISAFNFSELQPVKMRMEQKAGTNNCTIINDSYNCDFTSLTIALDFLSQQNQHTLKTLILSDIKEVGTDDEKLYSQIADILTQNNIYKIIGIGENIYKNRSLFSIEKKFYKTTNSFLSDKTIVFRNETILLKGARSFKFEKIAKQLQKQNHITVMEINLQAIIDNLNYFRSYLNSKTKTMVMVKAFSYGSGTYELANILQHQQVDYLGVAYIDEGIELRKKGITIPIMVMNPVTDNFSNFYKYNLEPEIYSFSILKKYISSLNFNEIETLNIHIKLDTGMNRLGFLPQQIDDLILVLKKHNNIKIKSVFSHLVGTSESEHDEFTRQQVALFELMSLKIMSNFDYYIMKHILNSGGIERFSEYQYDMVRVGIGLYGISALNQNNVKNIATFKTQISQIKNVTSKDTVGYGRVGIAEQDSKIGIIPVGYADGFNRLLSNKRGRVLVNNKYFAPIIGNICMDMCMIDLTNIPANENDEIVLIGDKITVTEIANLTQTIPYEVYTSISQRVKRVYVLE